MLRRRGLRRRRCACTSAGETTRTHDYDIPLERIISIVLRARPATILFEAANPRHEHEWKVWSNAPIPEDKLLAPGLIDTCSNYVEHPNSLLNELSALRPLSALSGNCEY